MRAITATFLIGAALTAGGTATYEALTPHGAAWFNEGKMVPGDAEFSAEQVNENVSQDGGIIKKHTNQGQMDEPRYPNNVYADFRATGPPQMDSYPKSPEEAVNRESKNSVKSPSNLANYGVYDYWNHWEPVQTKK